MLTIYIIFILSLIFAEKMWSFSAEFGRRKYGRKAELLTMIAGCIILGVGEIFVTNKHLEYAMQQEGVEEALIAYTMLISLAGVQLLETSETMKKYKNISDKLVILGISLFCLLVGCIMGLI